MKKPTEDNDCLGEVKSRVRNRFFFIFSFEPERDLNFKDNSKIHIRY
jgi:hypothetical protein